MVKYLRIFRVSFRALGRNKMRTFLTALGIIIGVGAVIAMVSIGAGAKAGIKQRFENMGTNLLTVRPGSMNQGGIHLGFGMRTTLKVDDVQAIERECPSVQAVTPNVNTQQQVINGNKNWRTQIYGVSEQYPSIRRWDIEEGDFFDREQVEGDAKVAVIGMEVRRNLFEDNEEVLGRVIRIRRVPFTIIGVLKSKGQAGGFFNQDDLICVPYTTAGKRLMRYTNVSSIDVSAISPELMPNAQAEITGLLHDRHHIQEGQDDDFNVRNMADVAESLQSAMGVLQLLLGSIAAISLLVGGIGIMNIMLVSVTERIREIGIRMSIGAKESDILLQFLLEAIVLSLTGGILGIALGVGTSKVLRVIPIFANITTVVSTGSVVLSFIFAGSIGVFFGFYPARKASKLDPIDALRYE
jgi:putative ABC transport system permease protein